MKKERLDVLVLDRGLAGTPAKAQAMILAGQVIVDDRRIDKPGTRVSTASEIRLKGEAIPYVSRGGLKLKAAIDQFKIDVTGMICADIGASTGGFSDCLLQEGARRVHAIDVGRGQLHEKLRRDPRIVSRERVNARLLTEADLPELVDVVVIDVSFISLKLVVPAIVPRMRPRAMLIPLIKPQFEIEPERLDRGGVLRDLEARARAIAEVTQFIRALGFDIVGSMDCPVHGPAGNVEALLVGRLNPPREDR
jgi:23S rRNA (cytidine1920-2'-O)/16S rRNA (cytidine1409-2'-O)-methyltransferase